MTRLQSAAAGQLLAALLDRVITHHDPDLIREQLDPAFQLWCNGKVYGRESFVERVSEALAASQAYAVDYDDRTWVNQYDRAAVHLWVSSAPASAEASDSEALVIVTIQDGRLHQAWVLAWPDRPQLHRPLAPSDHDASTMERRASDMRSTVSARLHGQPSRSSTSAPGGHQASV
jgi:hypothetical protein